MTSPIPATQTSQPGTTTKTADIWVWEYSNQDGTTVYSYAEYPTMPVVREVADLVAGDIFAEFTWGEITRRGIVGTSVLAKNCEGGWFDTGYWAYRKPATAEA